MHGCLKMNKLLSLRTPGVGFSSMYANRISIASCPESIEEGERPYVCDRALETREDEAYQREDMIGDPSSATDSPNDANYNDDNDPQMQDVDVTHPWKIVDYHLYLASAERGTDKESRRNCMFLYDGDDCRPFFFWELQEEQSLDPFLVGSQPKLLFGILPIADATASFHGMAYALGFDYFTRTFFARFFTWMPQNVGDIWSVWDEGYDTYGLTIVGLYQLLKATFDDGEGNVSIGLLSSSPYCLALHNNDDPGLEIVIAIRYCQWVVDFAEAIFEQEKGVVDSLTSEFSRYMEKCRSILQKASSRAWSAISSCHSRRSNRRNMFVNKYTNDLFTFSESAKDASLKGHGWHAPSIETCNRIREDNRHLVKEQAVRGLEGLFTKTENTDSGPEVQTQKQALEKMLEKSKSDYQEPLFSRSLKTPAAPSPAPSPSCQRSLVERGRWVPDPDDNGTVRHFSEVYDSYEIVEYHKMPMIDILRQASNLIISRTELDTRENRTRLGALLTDIVMGVRKKQKEITNTTAIGQENDSDDDHAADIWGFGMMEDPGARPCSLLD